MEDGITVENGFPSFTFLIPVLNGERHIKRALKSIRGQDYPQEKVEIIVLDGGCTDSSISIARSFGCRIYPNPGRLAEYGLQVGMRYARGDLVVIFACDNELSEDRWLEKVKEPFVTDRECSCAWGILRSGKDDPSLNKYFELIQSDPFTYFMNRNIEYYLSHPATVRKGDWYFFTIESNKPLAWGANGLTVRRTIAEPIWAQEGYLGDNDAFQQMIEDGYNRVAFAPGLVTYHHHVGRIGDWISKWKRNFSQHFLDKLSTRNTNWIFVEDFRFRLIMWLIYATNPFVSGSHALYLSIRDRNPYWVYHPVMCFLQTFVYGYLTLTSPEGREMMARILKHGFYKSKP